MPPCTHDLPAVILMESPSGGDDGDPWVQWFICAMCGDAVFSWYAPHMNEGGYLVFDNEDMKRMLQTMNRYKKARGIIGGGDEA